MVLISSVSLESALISTNDFSLNQTRKLIAESSVKVNGKSVTSLNYKLFDKEYVISVSGKKYLFEFDNGMPKILKEN